MAPGANIYGVKVLSDSGSGSDSIVLAGMEFVISQRLKNVTRPIVASMSLGGSCTNCQSAATVSFLDCPVCFLFFVLMDCCNCR